MNTCQACGQSYGIDFMVPDEIWEKIRPKEKVGESGLLCGYCIVTRLEVIETYWAYRIENID